MRHLLPLLLAACATLTAGEAPRTIGLLLPGLGSDGGWNQLARDAATQVAKDLGAKLSILQKVPQDKAGDELRDCAAQGFGAVIAHGYEFLNPATEVAGDLKGLRIAVSGADLAKPGLTTLDFDLSQASYQVGVLAARVSRGGKLGFLGGARIPSVLACLRGFTAGARSVRPDATVAEGYPGWDQPAEAKAQTEAMLRAGVDVVFQDVDAASRGVFEAVQASGTAWAIGSCADQNAQPRVLASAVIRLDRAFRAFLTGATGPGLKREDLASGTCIAVLNPQLLGSVITPAVQAEVEAAGKRLAAGEITIPK